MTADRPLDLLVVGDANPDVVLSGVPDAIAYAQVEQLVDTGTLTVGGSAAILACGAARLGLRAALVSVVGDDGAGRFMLDQLRRRDVDVAGVHLGKGLATGLTVHLITDERVGRAMLTFPGCITALDDQMVPRELLRSARHVHVSSFFLQPLLGAGLRGLFEAAHEAGATTSLDTNWDPADRWAGLAQVLPVTDLLFPNGEEAVAIAQALAPDDPRRDVEGAARALAALGPLAVVKLGADGALLVDGRRVIRIGAPTVGVVDPVGAGDSFDAGFLAGWLNGDGLERSLALGAACGSLSMRGAGGTGWQPTRDEADRLVHGGGSGA